MKIDINKLKEFIPSSERNINRLSFILDNPNEIRVAVFGKYNHGKSTLLNAIIGEEIFRAADKRETTEIGQYKSQGIVWVDTPGLDADIHGEDDRRAKEGAFKIADFIFLVHSVKTGELDKYETQLYRELMKQDKNYQKKMFLILTQIDQLEKIDLEKVKKRIKEQFSDLIIIPVSATRYIRGKLENKPIFVEKSGMNPLFNFIKILNKNTELLRSHEKKRLLDKVKIELDEKRKEIKSSLESFHHKLIKNQNLFNTAVNSYIDNVQAKA